MSSDEEIKAEAKQIMDDFMNAMESISVEETFTLHRESCFREEGDGNEPDYAFRERFLNNAPKRRGDSIYVKKGEWLN